MSVESRTHVTVTDVAREAGVSVATAARALGDYGSVSAKSREAVQRAAQQLGYSPNMLARSMITGSTNTLGVIVADIENQFFLRALGAITDVAGKARYDVILANTDEDPERERRALAVMSSRRVDGIILSPTDESDADEITAVAANGVPVVLIDRRLASKGTDAVGIDNHKAAKEATEHLLRLGHTRIGVVTGGGPEVQDRLRSGSLASLRRMPATTLGSRTAGYRAALTGHGVECLPEYVAANGFHRSDARDAAIAFARLPKPPTAVIAFDSLLALGVMQGLRQEAVDIPGEMSLLCFDDAEWADVVRPALTVIRQPTDAIGRHAAELVLERIGGSTRPPVDARLPTELVIRDSVAAAPAS